MNKPNEADKETKESSVGTMKNEWKRPLETLQKSITMKNNMMKKGLLRAKAKCPYCDGYWHAVLMGRKNHIHMHCDGECKAIMME